MDAICKNSNIKSNLLNFTYNLNDGDRGQLINVLNSGTNKSEYDKIKADIQSEIERSRPKEDMPSFFKDELERQRNPNPNSDYPRLPPNIPLDRPRSAGGGGRRRTKKSKYYNKRKRTKRRRVKRRRTNKRRN